LHPPSAEISLTVSPPSPAVKSESSTENIPEAAAAAAHRRLSAGEGRDFAAAEDSGALNLTKGSLTITPVTETGGGLKGWSPPSPPAVGGGGNVASPKSPQGYRPASYNSSDLCVVCGDRASGQCANAAVFKELFQK